MQIKPNLRNYVFLEFFDSLNPLAVFLFRLPSIHPHCVMCFPLSYRRPHGPHSVLCKETFIIKWFIRGYCSQRLLHYYVKVGLNGYFHMSSMDCRPDHRRCIEQSSKIERILWVTRKSREGTDDLLTSRYRGADIFFTL